MNRSLAPNAARRASDSRAITARSSLVRDVEQDLGRQHAAAERDVDAVARHRVDEAGRITREQQPRHADGARINGQGPQRDDTSHLARARRIDRATTGHA